MCSGWWSEESRIHDPNTKSAKFGIESEPNGSLGTPYTVASDSVSSTQMEALLPMLSMTLISRLGVKPYPKRPLCDNYSKKRDYRIDSQWTKNDTTVREEGMCGVCLAGARRRLVIEL